MPEVFSRWQDRRNMSFQFPGGEQRRGFFHRVGATLDDITARHPDELVAVVAHGGTIRAGLAHIFPDTMSDWWTYKLGNGSVTLVRVDWPGSALLALNDCSHLVTEG